MLLLSLLPSLAACLSTLSSQAQEHGVRYEVGLQQARTQMVSVAATFPTAGRETLDVSLPAWRPGRYEILDAVGGLRDLQAEDPQGSVLELRQTAKATWSIDPGGAPSVTLRYRIYANSIGDRTRHADATHAFLSGSAVFVYSQALRDLPIDVQFDAPEGWRCATGLQARGELRFHAPNYDVLVDSPFEVGLHDRYDFRVGETDYELIVWPTGVEIDFERMRKDMGKIIEAQTEVFGEVPCERYVFLVHAGAGGGGTEHLNSTIMQTSRSALEDSRDKGPGYNRYLGLVAHEFFHTWNVKQLRPAGIHPYDYQYENYTDLLWVAEGGTSYYGPLSMVRSSLTKESKYIDSLASSIDRMRRSPGNKVQSLSASSFDAWTKFNTRSADDVNSEVSFYSKGALACLLLDLEVRRRTENRVSLDDVMKDLYRRYPLSGSGYTSDNLIESLERHTDSEFKGLFAACIAGTEPLPLEAALETAGLELFFKPKEKDDKSEEGESEELEEPVAEAAAQKIPLKAYLGLRLGSGGSGSIVRNVLADGPAYTAGVLAGDEILTLDKRRLNSGSLDKRLKRMEPGATVTLHLLRRDELMEFHIELAGVPEGKWSIRRVKQATDQQKAVYAGWLGHPWEVAKAAEE